MPYKKSYSKKAKWRQQKLAVGTIEKIARRVAKGLDKAQDKLHLYDEKFTADGFNWDSALQLPPQNQWRPVLSGGIESKAISNITALVQDGQVPGSAGNANPENLTIAVRGVQCRFAITNREAIPCRVEAQLIYIPNLNRQTQDAVDFLRPDVFMLYKKGTGNILYDGFSKDTLKNKATTASSVRTYTILARKVIYLHGSSNSGQNIPIPVDPAEPDSFDHTADVPYYTHKRVTLTKYFKRDRKHNIKSGVEGNPMTDGNYYFILWSDLPTGNFIHYVAMSSVKFRVLSTTDNIAGTP